MISNVNSIGQGQGNGTTTVFGIVDQNGSPIPFTAQGDIAVTLFNQTTEALVSPAPVLNGGGTYDYTITGTQDSSTNLFISGSVTFNTAPPANCLVTWQRQVPATQSYNATDGSPLPAGPLNAELDRLTMLAGDALGQLGLALQFPVQDGTALENVLPPAALRAGFALGFDAEGNVSVGAQGAFQPISAAMAPVVAATSIGAADVLLMAGMTSTAIEALPTTAIAGLTSTQIGALTTTSIGGIQATQLAALSTTAIQGLTTTQLSALTTTQAGALDGPLMLGMTTTAIRQLPTTAIQGLTSTQISALATTALGGIQATQLAALPTTAIAGLTSTQISALTTTSIGGIQATQLAAISTTAIRGLTTSQLSSLTTTQAGALDGPLMLGMTTTAIQNLSTTAIGGLLAAQASALQTVLQQAAPWAGFVNKFRNPDFKINQRGVSSLTVTTSGAYTADGWIVVPTGASCTVTPGHGRMTGALGSNSLLITGASSVTDILIKQRIESSDAAPLAGQQVTVQITITNNTGGSITPTLTVKHAGTADSWGSPVTDVSAVSLQTVGSGAEATLAYCFAATANTINGLEVTFDFGNNFSTTGKNVVVADADIRVTPGVALGQVATPAIPEFRPVPLEMLWCAHYLPAVTSVAGKNFMSGFNISTTQAVCGIPFATPCRAVPSAISFGAAGHFEINPQVSTQIACTGVIISGYSSSNWGELFFTVASGLTSGADVMVEGVTAADAILFTGGEL